MKAICLLAVLTGLLNGPISVWDRIRHGPDYNESWQWNDKARATSKGAIEDYTKSARLKAVQVAMELPTIIEPMPG